MESNTSKGKSKVEMRQNERPSGRPCGEADQEVLPTLKPWRVRFWYQFSALSYKQLLVYGRSARATALRLLAPLFFMLLLWLLDIAVRSDNSAISAFENNPDPSVDPVEGIPSCTNDIFIQQPCYDFIYSPNTSATANSIAEAMRMNNPGRSISEDAVLSFASIADANAWLLENPAKASGGVHFLYDANAPGDLGELVDSASNIDFVLQFNSTPKYFKADFKDPTFAVAVPLQVSVEREVSRFQWNTTGQDPSSLSWNVSTSQFAHPLVGSVDIIGRAMGPFVFAANMFNFVLLLASIVSEREKGLRQALTTAGMLDSAFWASWLLIELIISVIFTLLLIGFGAMFSFDFFLRNSFGLVFLLFLTFQWAMTASAFLLSAFISKTSTAINMGFIIFIVGWIIQSVIIFGYPYTPDYIDSVAVLTVIFTLLPFAPLAKGSLDLGDAVQGSREGISWSRRFDYCKDISDSEEISAIISSNAQEYWDFDCVFPLGTILGVLALEFIVYMIIAIYFDNVFANENGVRKKPWYFLSPSYWGYLRNRHTLQSPVECPQKELEQDSDVAVESMAMQQVLLRRTNPAGSLGITKHPVANGAEGEREVAPGVEDAEAFDEDFLKGNAVEVFGLQKKFGSVGIFRRLWRKMSRRKQTSLAAADGESNNAAAARKKKTSSKSKKRPAEFWAIKGSWFRIQKGKLFCLLGPNGAGKTTTINCLTGVLPLTGGDALVYGESVTAPGGLDRIRSVMGVCPQFDVLWGELTGLEHLHIYGRVKGMTLAETKKQSYDLLEAVKLTAAAKQRTGAYSGGMRRRLSVAVALLGDPKIVYLDEPTTGMDPISRRHVWDVIEAVKPGRAIVLTTHSMEEADILGDEVAIMARGWLKAFGTPLRLKQRFGSGYHLSIAISGSDETSSYHSPIKSSDTDYGDKDDLEYPMDAESSSQNSPLKDISSEVDGSVMQRQQRCAQAVIALLKKSLDISPVDDMEQDTGSYLVFRIPNEKVKELDGVLRDLESRRLELGISDVQISLTTLEDVFLAIARQAELEAAAVEGCTTQTIILDDNSELHVDLGADEAVQDSTGRRFSISWAQDEFGQLQVLSWAEITEQ